MLKRLKRIPSAKKKIGGALSNLRRRIYLAARAFRAGDDYKSAFIKQKQRAEHTRKKVKALESRVSTLRKAYFTHQNKIKEYAARVNADALEKQNLKQRVQKGEKSRGSAPKPQSLRPDTQQEIQNGEHGTWATSSSRSIDNRASAARSDKRESDKATKTEAHVARQDFQSADRDDNNRTTDLEDTKKVLAARDRELAERDAQISGYEKRLQSVDEKIERLNARDQAKQDRILKLRDMTERQRQTIQNQTDRINALRLEVSAYQGLAFPDATKKASPQDPTPPLQEHIAEGIAPILWKNAPVNLYLNFANNAHQISDALAADVYLAHGVQALLAARTVAETQGGRVFGDVVEVPSFRHRARPAGWHPSNLRLMDYAFDGCLRECDGLLTVSWALKENLSPYGVPVSVIPNFRYRQDFAKSNRLRELCEFDETTRIVLSLSTVSSHMENLVKSLKHMPEDVCIAQLGRIVPNDYDARIRNLISDMGLDQRVRLLDPVPYDELTATAAGADVGIFVCDPEILNNYVSLPNRVFDFLASGLPFCAPRIPDIADIQERRDVGTVVEETSPEGWAASIQATLNRRDQMHRNALSAAQELTWESQEDNLAASLGNPNSITFFGVNDLAQNNRTQRMAKSLAERGVTVKICTRRDQEAPENPHVTYYVLP